jgi:hypothetical protein
MFVERSGFFEQNGLGDFFVQSGHEQWKQQPQRLCERAAKVRRQDIAIRYAES